MRLTFVVPRFGEDVLGGAERFCRDLALRLAERGHDMTVVTSCATSYSTWDNELSPGLSRDGGVTVHRLEVDRPRVTSLFNTIHDRVLEPMSCPPAPVLQEAWMRAQGPWLPELPAVLASLASRTDVMAFFPYLYATTWLGLRAAAGRTVTIMHPCAHDEPPLHLPIFDGLLRLPDAYAFLTPEEQALFESRVGRPVPAIVVGSGVEGPDGRARLPTVDDATPFLLFLGRVDPAKGTNELYDFFVTYKDRRPGPLRLVLAGEPVVPLPPHPDVDVVGSVPESEKWDLYRRARVFVVPSYFESFSLVLAEAWLAGVPALVQRRSAVLAGQTRRSRGGLAYAGYAEFESMLDRLLADDDLRRRMGDAGRRYVLAEYQWDKVLARYETFLDEVLATAR